MKKILILFLLTTSIALSQTVEYPITCYKKELGPDHASYFFIISVKNIYFYNFTDHMVKDEDFKKLFWKKSNTIPLDTTGFEMMCNTKIREDQISEKLKLEIAKIN